MSTTIAPKTPNAFFIFRQVSPGNWKIKPYFWVTLGLAVFILLFTHALLGGALLIINGINYYVSKKKLPQFTTIEQPVSGGTV